VNNLSGFLYIPGNKYAKDKKIRIDIF